MAKLFQNFFSKFGYFFTKKKEELWQNILFQLNFFCILAKSCTKEKKWGKKENCITSSLNLPPIGSRKKKFFSQNVFFSIEMTHLMTSPKETHSWHQLPKKTTPHTQPKTPIPQKSTQKKKKRKERKKERKKKRERERERPTLKRRGQ